MRERHTSAMCVTWRASTLRVTSYARGCVTSVAVPSYQAPCPHLRLLRCRQLLDCLLVLRSQ
jgi:hypothetical protein